MISLFWGLWEYLFSKAEVHLLIIGLDYAGKTTLLEQLKGMFGKKAGIPLDKIPPTVGLNIAKVDISRTNVIFWDLGGQERLRAIWSKYYSESHGIVFVVDSTDAARLDEAKTALDTMLANPELADAPLLVLANKKDLAAAKDTSDLTSRLGLDSIASTHTWTIRPVSALTTYVCLISLSRVSFDSSDGISDAVLWFIQTVKNSDRFQAKQVSKS
ncbi:Aste57867_10452 [Aphanomyces stellatus]|uniref:Aste57867_10452 protein n=1 Tax=Aphanomyces stellatus TaxID=120398 RepID=A0A485KR06_9STRA|nr:hypothetical protein As57867_010412 [Aphanomyces stellatus]VFT87326.1 Aste57867_10452 [Aphanomyces stellatus]